VRDQHARRGFVRNADRGAGGVANHVSHSVCSVPLWLLKHRFARDRPGNACAPEALKPHTRFFSYHREKFEPQSAQRIHYSLSVPESRYYFAASPSSRCRAAPLPSPLLLHPATELLNTKRDGVATVPCVFQIVVNLTDDLHCATEVAAPLHPTTQLLCPQLCFARTQLISSLVAGFFSIPSISRSL